QRGQRRDLVILAEKNAASSFVSRRDKSRDAEAAMDKLQQRLSLKRLPRRIECFDISHIQGTATVASMVVFLDGEPAKAEYRTLRSALEDVPGVGQKRKRELLKHFGALKNVKTASVEELLRAPGMSRAAAEAVVRYFRGDPDPTPPSAAPDELQGEDVAEDAA